MHIEDLQSVRMLTLDAPGRMNAIPPEGWEALGSHIAEFEKSSQRVLIIAGAGGDFCAGADLADGRLPSGIAERNQVMRQVGATASALLKTTKPTVAAVDGVAVGAGMNLALACDVVIATPGARFSEIFVKRGLTLDFGGTWLLPRLVGLQRAKELALSGRMVQGSEAIAIGLCLELVDQDDLIPRALEIAEGFVSAAPVPQLFIKQALNRSFEVSLEEALSYEGQAQAICHSSDDAQEGIRAFREKRPPEWVGR